MPCDSFAVSDQHLEPQLTYTVTVAMNGTGSMDCSGEDERTIGGGVLASGGGSSVGPGERLARSPAATSPGVSSSIELL